MSPVQRFTTAFKVVSLKLLLMLRRESYYLLKSSLSYIGF